MDEIDYSTSEQQSTEEKAIAAAMKAASEIPEGIAGECIECGEESKRIVDGKCAPCRDREARMYRTW